MFLKEEFDEGKLKLILQESWNDISIIYKLIYKGGYDWRNCFWMERIRWLWKSKGLEKMIILTTYINNYKITRIRMKHRVLYIKMSLMYICYTKIYK